MRVHRHRHHLPGGVIEALREPHDESLGGGEAGAGGGVAVSEVLGGKTDTWLISLQSLVSCLQQLQNGEVPDALPPRALDLGRVLRADENIAEASQLRSWEVARGEDSASAFSTGERPEGMSHPLPDGRVTFVPVLGGGAVAGSDVSAARAG